MDSMRAQQGMRRTPARYQIIPEEQTLNEGEYDDAWPARAPSSARRYQDLADVRTEMGRAADVQVQPGRRAVREQHTIPPRRTATQSRIPAIQARPPRVQINEEGLRTDVAEAHHPRRLSQGGQRRFHWLFFAGLTMLVMLLGWIALSALGSWWQTTQNDWRYGRPRTFQIDQVVGQNDSPQNPSHFIAMNLNRHILIIEFPGGDVSKSVVFSGPTLLGPGQDLTPVTLTFRDVNHDGKLDMIVNVQGSQFVFLNEKGTFVPAPQNQNSSG